MLVSRIYTDIHSVIPPHITLGFIAMSNEPGRLAKFSDPVAQALEFDTSSGTESENDYPNPMHAMSDKTVRNTLFQNPKLKKDVEAFEDMCLDKNEGKLWGAYFSQYPGVVYYNVEHWVEQKEHISQGCTEERNDSYDGDSSEKSYPFSQSPMNSPTSSDGASSVDGSENGDRHYYDEGLNNHIQCDTVFGPYNP